MHAVKQLLWWLIAGTEGGANRARIIHALKTDPCNANQLAERLNLDYKTVRHHIDVLAKNNLITSMGDKYGKMYFLTSLIEKNYDVFEQIWVKIGKNEVKRENNRDVKT